MDPRDLLIEQLLEKLADRDAKIVALEAKVAELERRLGLNSRNSSKPPSTDGFRKPPKPTSLREKGKKKSGGQAGHKGDTLKQVLHPDVVVTHSVTQCSHCAQPLQKQPAQKVIKRQVFDLIKPKLEVTEHQAEVKTCPCCQTRCVAEFPAEVPGPVQYGALVKSYGVYLQQQHFIPEDRLQDVFFDLFGISLATATLVGFTHQLSEQLVDFEKELLKKIQAAPVKHLDETGFRVQGKTQWLHVACTHDATYYHVSPKRKSLLVGLEGVVVHDHWGAYFKLPNVQHALCNQHHLRELKARMEQDKEGWAMKMARFLRRALHYRKRYGENPIPSDRIERLVILYEGIITEGFTYHEGLPAYAQRKGRGRAAKRPGHNLLLRLRDKRDAVLRFLSNPLVPFTNNQAEQDVRMMKCKQKISGGFRTEKGAAVFARIRGFISTARKQGWNILQALSSALSGNTPLPA